MAKVNDKEKKIKKSWDFSALSDSDGPGSSHELDYFPIEEKEKKSSVDPLSTILFEKENEYKNDSNIILKSPSFSENDSISTMLSKTTSEEENSNLLLKKKEIVFEQKIINNEKTEIEFQNLEEDFSIAKMIKAKPISTEEEDIENSVHEKDIKDSATIAKERLNLDLKRNSESSYLVPSIVKQEIKKKVLFSPWEYVDQTDKNKTYVCTIIAMIAFMSIGTTIIF